MFGSELPTLCNSHQVAVHFKIHVGKVYTAALTGRIRPDARTITGLPLFNAERLEEIEKALKQTRTQNG